MRLLFYPAFDDSVILTDHFFRLHWYLYPFRNQITEVILPRKSDSVDCGETPNFLDRDLDRLVGDIPISQVTVADDDQLGEYIENADAVFQWAVDPARPNAPAPALNGMRTIKIDHRHLRGAGSYYLMFGKQFGELQAAYLDQSRKVFERIHQRCKSEVGYVFGTGPGLAQAKNHDFSDGVSIACNSMVRNYELLERLQPPLIVVADPIFHAGPSSYASAFRKDLIRALDRYDSDLIVPMRDYHIYLQHLPERFADRIAAIPFENDEVPNLDLTQSFHVTTTANVLTLFLLPLAATFFENIRIFGCDGRPLKANSYFWSHDKASQFNDEMDDIKQAHPAFFDIDYDDYYQTHCETLTAWLDEAEKLGKQITNHTSSHIPALASRSVKGVKSFEQINAEKTLTQLISIDPDGINDSGHFLKYNERLAEACNALGVKYGVMGRANIDVSCVPPGLDVHPTFSVHSWEMSVQPDGNRSPFAARFKEEFENSIAAIAQGEAEKTALYMYCGSLEHAHSLLPSLEKYDNLYANVNLFWQSFVNYRNIRYINRWRPEVMRMAACEKLTLTAPTEQIRDDMERIFGLKIAVAPHPSTTFPDAAAVELAKSKEHRSQDRKTILFPGGMRPEKGFLLTAKVAPLLASDPDLKVSVRTSLNNSKPDALQHLEALAESNCELVSEELNDDEFQQFLQSGDIIVCPYLNPQFRARTSGLVIDALLLGRPVVAVKDTWLGDFVERNGAGIAADANVDSLVSAVETVSKKFDEFASNAALARTEYLKKHSWRQLLKTVADGTMSKPQAESSESLNDAEKRRDDLIKQLPGNVRSPIFMPTDRVPLQQQIEGIGKARDVYNRELDSDYRPRLRDLKKSRRLKRCFVIGNGPSLKQTDLSLLKDEDTFATNGFFLKLPELDWMPTYYVVEDHLVAEDRAHEINMLRGFNKLFPANLRYALNPDSDTIFFDHRPRKSFPDGFDFSFDADVHTYAGGTVTFTCLELAAYLGYEEIYLIGVDASYEIPKDATLSGASRVKEIDMKSDDPNHFHPDYFGKGKRWHEPNVNVMIEAYKEAKRECDLRGVKIINATIGGRLEVFPRASFDQVLDARPRLLLIDHTRIGNGTASGELKASLFETWPSDRLMHVYSAADDEIAVTQSNKVAVLKKSSHLQELEAKIRGFRPDLILYRPVPDTSVLHSAAMQLIQSSDLPLALWIFDDWPSSFSPADQASYDRVRNDLPALLQRSKLRLSISSAMSKAFAERYGCLFTTIANGVNPNEWPIAEEKPENSTVRIRYAGSLAENMTLKTIVSVAHAVEKLAKEGLDVVFEIKTRAAWHAQISRHTKNLKHVRIYAKDLSSSEYKAWMAAGHVVVIGYNFDDSSKHYVRYSVANKLPECLACGAALLAVGPPDVATLSTLERLDCGVRVTRNDQAEIVEAIKGLVTSPRKRFELAKRAQKVAFEQFNLRDISSRFEMALTHAAFPEKRFNQELPRAVHAHVDETEVVSALLADRRGPEHTLIDVGAHFGSSAAYFHKLNWTIYCFEPDPDNRTKLLGRYENAANVTIDTRAVSDKTGQVLPFFKSPESTGISGLNQFRETHNEAMKVETTTIADYVKEKNISHVDFLKIDVEGFDFSVLKGIPWDTLQPDVIECEFEDAKTTRLGHTWRDIAEYLAGNGYTVYISEWHPIVRYGIRHDWRRIAPYPGTEVDANGWGNLLAFKQDPGYEAVHEAFEALVKKKSEPAAKAPAQAKQHGGRASSPVLAVHPGSSTRIFNEAIDKKIEKISPRIYGALIICKRSMAGFWRRRIWTLPALIIVASIAMLGLIPELSVYRIPIWGFAAFATAMFAVFYLGLRTYQHISTLASETAQLRNALAKTATVQSQASLESKFEKKMLETTGLYDSKFATLTKKFFDLAADAASLNSALDANEKKLQSDLDTATQELKRELDATTKGLKQELDAVVSGVKEDMQSRNNELKVEFDDQSSHIGRLRERVAAGERQIGDIRYPNSPECIVYFGHHKCGSRFFREEIFTQVAEMLGARLRRYEVVNPPFHYSRMDELDLCNIDFEELGVDGRDVVMFANSTERSVDKIKRSAGNWKGIRVLRDPRQVLVSNYFNHKGSHHTELNGWIWDQLKQDKPILRDLSEEEGLLYELDNISKQVIEEQLMHAFDDDRILTIRLEDFSQNPKDHLKLMAEFLETPDIAGIALSQKRANKDSGPWRRHFTSRLRDAFKKRYGQALIDMGYAEDLDW